MLHDFITYLRDKNLSPNSIKAYVFTVDSFIKTYKSFSKRTLLLYKEHLVKSFKPQTVNLRIQGINRYLDFKNLPGLKLSFVKIQRKNFVETVISNEDYLYFKKRLKKDGNLDWFYVVWFLGATGARISELLQVKAEHVFSGHFDIYSKGGKMRRLYVPTHLQVKAILWLNEKGISSGPVFLNRFGRPISPRGVSIQLKALAEKYGLSSEVIYPHSFRHLFAKNFLARHNDIALLADLLGHTNIETTRIYLRQSSSEQRRLLDHIINW